MSESSAIGYKIKGKTMWHTKLLDKGEINTNTQNCTIVLI